MLGSSLEGVEGVWMRMVGAELVMDSLRDPPVPFWDLLVISLGALKNKPFFGECEGGFFSAPGRWDLVAHWFGVASLSLSAVLSPADCTQADGCRGDIMVR